MKEPWPNSNASDPSGCRLRAETPTNDGDPAARRRAKFVEARARMAARPISQLIELLASRDLRTRFLAEMSLRDATGT